MKKIIVFLLCLTAVFTLSGCSMNNTPTKRVENFLDSYRSGNDTVLKQLKEMVDSDAMMNEAQRTTYSDIMKKQYKDMTYEIKDEQINGDEATVTTEIEVYDYYKTNRDSQDYFNNNRDQFKEDNSESTSEKEGDNKDSETDNSDNLSNEKYIDYRLGELQNSSDRIKYTIDFTLRKENDKWILNEIDDATRQKIHGLYEH